MGEGLAELLEWVDQVNREELMGLRVLELSGK